MQGRLSPMVHNKIQCFPWEHWQDEFAHAHALGLSLMEWTLDQERLYENPLMTVAGQARIRTLMQRHRVAVPSLTGDCFMQTPFYKALPTDRVQLLRDLQNILQSCAAIGIRYILIPLVDNGSITTDEEERLLKAGLAQVVPDLKKHAQKILFESDFAPTRLRTFMNDLSPECFGINYDSGNSAALGFDPDEEFVTYGAWIVNVHIKDRVRGGTTVPLGTGNTDFPKVFRGLRKMGYQGNYILQTARSSTGQHAQCLANYRNMVLEWI